MIFSSAEFFVFFPLVLFAYALCRTLAQRATVLLVASLVFYASWKPSYLVLLGASLLVNYYVYHVLLATRSRAVLVTGICFNLLLLGLFKYSGMILQSVQWFSHGGASAPTHDSGWVDWALPLGISFYTFHMLSAIIDVYRGDWAKPVSLRTWCLYVTYFPHLIAGPILRPGQLIDQLNDLKPLSGSDMRLGAAIFAGGLVKKVMFADNLAPIVEKLYSVPGDLTFGNAWLATLAFAFQIYFDFSGYSEMAIGLARMMGVDLPRNFVYPYIARSPTEFWHRWHITLSRWLRDYLYISLGGSRRGPTRTYVNLMLTMLLGGLWHGANWTFVVWGMLHGMLLIGARALNGVYARIGLADRPRAARIVSALGMPVTFVLVCLTWVFFRAPSFDVAYLVLRAMLGGQHAGGAPVNVRLYEIGIVLVSAALVFLEPLVVPRLKGTVIARWWLVPFPLRGTAYAIGMLVLLVFGGATQKFIYFDF